MAKRGLFSFLRKKPDEANDAESRAHPSETLGARVLSSHTATWDP